MQDGDIAGAYVAYSHISDYSDSATIAEGIKADYDAAAKLLEEGKYDEANAAFLALKNYSDSETQANESLYRKAAALAEEGRCAEAAALFDELGEYSDSNDKANEAHYNTANTLWQSGDLQGAVAEFEALGDYSDAPQLLTQVNTEIANKALVEKDYATALTAYQHLEQTDEIKAKEYELAQACYDEGHFAEATSAYETLGQYELSLSKLPIARYAWADQLFNEGSYAEAAEQFTILGEMTDSAERAKESTYQLANQQLEAKEYDTAKATFLTIKGYSDADTMAQECDYRKASDMLADSEYKNAQTLFEGLGTYSDSATKAKQCVYEQADALYAEADYAGAEKLYASVDYEDSADKAKQCVYNQALKLYESEDYAGAEGLLTSIESYNDSAEMIKECRLQQGIELMDKSNYEDALEYLEALDFDNSAMLAIQCHYALGLSALNAGRTDDAVSEYAQAVTLPEARESLMSIAKEYAAINEIEKAVQTLWLMRENEDAKNMLKEIGDLKCQSGENGMALLAYCAIGDINMTELQSLVSEKNLEAVEGVLSGCKLLPNEMAFSDFERYMCASVSLLADEFDCAITEFAVLGEYADAPVQLLESKYRKGASQLENGDYDAAVVLFSGISEYKDAEEQIKECKYLKAKSLFDLSQYLDAYNIFSEINGYKDVSSLLKDEPKLAAIEIQNENFTIGNSISFGNYHGSITWLVIQRENDKALLISKDIIDYKPKDGIKSWLQKEIYERALSEDERNAVEKDGVFLLTQDQANTILSKEQRKAQSTSFAQSEYKKTVARGRTQDWRLNCWWIMGAKSGYHVDDNGVSDRSETGSNVCLGIRPSLWVNVYDTAFWPF